MKTRLILLLALGTILLSCSKKDKEKDKEWPDSSNTGVKPGTTLSPWTPVSVPDGTIIENKDITIGIGMSGNNITIRNCKIHTYDEIFAIDFRSGTNLVVEDCDIYDTAPNGGYTAFNGSNITLRRCNIYNWENGGSAGSNLLIEDCYIHDPGHKPDAHNDGIEWGGGSNVTIRHNSIAIRDETSCVNIGGTSVTITNIQVLNNRFYGGTYSLALEGRWGTTILNTTISGNVWVKNSYQYGTHFIENVQLSEVHWLNNSLDDETPVLP
jgi:hypothetical protein